MCRMPFHKMRAIPFSKVSGTMRKSRRDDVLCTAVELTSARFSLSRYAELLRPWNVRDKLHEHMPCGVTENGRAHLFSFSGHVTTASSRHICIIRLPYIHAAMRYSSRSRSWLTILFRAYRPTNDMPNVSSFSFLSSKKYFDSTLHFTFQSTRLILI